jgi:long-chain acyl-CoA synthetase
MSIILDKFHASTSSGPDRTAVVQCLGKGRAKNVTFAELDRSSEAVSMHLARQGIGAGDVVGIFMRRTIDQIAVILGILKTGAAFYSLNPRSTLEQVTYTARLARSAILFTDSGGLLTLQKLRRSEDSTLSLCLYSSEPDTASQEQLIAQVAETIPVIRVAASSTSEEDARRPRNVVGQDVALALFTSGSTGRPKGVLISHQDLFNRTITECEYYNITPEDVLLNLLPFSFDVGANQLFTALATGAQLVILNSWLLGDVASAIREYRVTGISAVPAIWTPILNGADRQILSAINSVRYITVSGGDLAPDQLVRLRELLGSTQIFKTYGQSETFRSTILLPSEYPTKYLSVGRPVRGTEVMILNQQGKRAPPDEAGEIIHCGDGTMLGYVGDVAGTRRKLRLDPIQNKRCPWRRRVVYTGDMGRMDSDGYLYVLGRKDKMIKTSGYRVYPKEVTDQILRHPAVQDAVVFGIPDRIAGTAVRCEIMLKSEHELIEAELVRFLSDKLPAYMIPSRVIFVTSFPRTASGKIRISEIERKHLG